MFKMLHEAVCMESNESVMCPGLSVRWGGTDEHFKTVRRKRAELQTPHIGSRLHYPLRTATPDL